MKAGDKVLVMTPTTHYWMGRIVEMDLWSITLDDAAWIPQIGRHHAGAGQRGTGQCHRDRAPPIRHAHGGTSSRIGCDRLAAPTVARCQVTLSDQLLAALASGPGLSPEEVADWTVRYEAETGDVSLRGVTAEELLVLLFGSRSGSQSWSWSRSGSGSGSRSRSGSLRGSVNMPTWLSAVSSACGSSSTSIRESPLRNGRCG
jgi:hypothetical protein